MFIRKLVFWFYDRKYVPLKVLFSTLAKLYYFIRKFKVLYLLLRYVELFIFKLYNFIIISFIKNKVYKKLVGKKLRRVIKKEKRYRKLIIVILYIIYSPILLLDFINKLDFRYRRFIRSYIRERKRREKKKSKKKFARRQNKKKFERRGRIFTFVSLFEITKIFKLHLKYFYDIYLYVNHFLRKWKWIVFFTYKYYHIYWVSRYIKRNRFLIYNAFYFLFFIFAFFFILHYLGFKDFVECIIWYIIWVFQFFIIYMKFSFSVLYGNIFLLKNLFYRNYGADFKFIKIFFTKFYYVTALGLSKRRNYYKFYQNTPVSRYFWTKGWDSVNMAWFGVPREFHTKFKKFREAKRWYEVFKRENKDFGSLSIIFKFIYSKPAYSVKKFGYYSKYKEIFKFKYNRFWFWLYRVSRIVYLLKYLLSPLTIFWWWSQKIFWTLWIVVIFTLKLPFIFIGFILKCWVKIWLSVFLFFLRSITKLLKLLFGRN